MDKILFFSNNKNKVKEINKILSKFNIKVLSPLDFHFFKEPKETGSSFAENAKIKSSFGYNISHIPCFSDDSGICIEAINWKPSIHSKRFIESFKNRDECFKKIIKKVRDTKKNKAYFKTSVCLTLGKNYHVAFEGKVRGIITDKALGKDGFGYDPIFVPDGFSKTFSEMNIVEKNKISHRAIAINKLVSFLFN